MSEPSDARESLWHCFHDARVRLQNCEPAQRRLSLRVSIPYLCSSAEVPEGGCFAFHMEGVGRVDCTPGSWGELAQALLDVDLEVLEAELERGVGNVALQLRGMLDGEVWHEVVFHAVTLEVTRCDGPSISLDALLELGKTYWSACP